MPFLEILTRTYKRPESLIKNIESVKQIQITSDLDIKHTFLIDEFGRGTAWANKNLGSYAEFIVGDYVWILDDDDVCIDTLLIQNLKQIVKDYQPKVIMAKCDIAYYQILPPSRLWKLRPVYTQISMSNFIVENSVYKTFAYAFPETLGGDYKFIAEVFEKIDETEIYWYDKIIMKAEQKGGGNPEK